MTFSASFEASPSRAMPARGFTLVEVLIATAISGILLMALSSSINNAVNAWTGHDRRIGMVREMRAAIDFLETDLAGFVALPDEPESDHDDEWLRFECGQPGDDLASARLLFLTTGRQSGVNKGLPDLGYVRLVAYATGLTEDANGRHSQKLFRKVFSADETQQRISASMRENLPLLTDSEWKSVEAGTDGADPIAYNLLRFTARPLKESNTSVAASGSVNGLQAENSAWLKQTRPAAVDLTLRIVTHRTASLLDSAADWRGESARSRQLLGQPPTPLDYSDDAEVATHQFRVLLP